MITIHIVFASLSVGLAPLIVYFAYQHRVFQGPVEVDGGYGIGDD